MDHIVCANCSWRNPFTCYCRFRRHSPTPFYYCQAWYPTCWISLLFSTEDEDGDYEKFLEELVN